MSDEGEDSFLRNAEFTLNPNEVGGVGLITPVKDDLHNRENKWTPSLTHEIKVEATPEGYGNLFDSSAKLKFGNITVVRQSNSLRREKHKVGIDDENSVSEVYSDPQNVLAPLDPPQPQNPNLEKLRKLDQELKAKIKEADEYGKMIEDWTW